MALQTIGGHANRSQDATGIGISQLLGKNSLRLTMHSLSKQAIEAVASELGVQIEV